MNNKISLSRKNITIKKRLVLVDGFSGSGKSLICSIISHFKNAEQWQMDFKYENLAILNYFHKISLKSAKALCETGVDENLYNLFIGRNVNFRSTDASSPLNNGLRTKYIKRLKDKDKKFAINKIIKSNPILILHIHYIFGYSKFLMEVFSDSLKLYILVLRNPFHLIEHWYKEYTSSLPGKKYPDFCPYIEIKKKLVPWYTKDYANYYLKANNLEKSILTIFELQKRIIKMFDKLSSKEKKKMQIIFFEEFLNSPNEEINLICKNLEFKKNKKFKNTLKKILSLSKKNKNNLKTINYEKFSNKYSKKISPKYKKMIIDLNKLYNDFNFKVRKITRI